MDWKELEKIFLSWNKCMTGTGGMSHGIRYLSQEEVREILEREEKRKERKWEKEKEKIRKEIEELVRKWEKVVEGMSYFGEEVEGKEEGEKKIKRKWRKLRWITRLPWEDIDWKWEREKVLGERKKNF